VLRWLWRSDPDSLPDAPAGPASRSEPFQAEHTGSAKERAQAMTSPIAANVFAVISRGALGIAVGSCLAIIAMELLGDYAATVGLGGAFPVAVTINIIALVVWAVSRLLQAVSRL
jgi:hypothetical protein